MPAAITAATASPARADVGEGRHDHPRRGRLGYQPDRHLGNDGQQAFRADHQRQQVIAGRVEGVIAEFDHLAGHGDAAHAQDVMHRQAVFQAMHAAGVFRHVAADAAGDLRTGIGGVVQPMRRRRLGDGQVAHAGLDHGDPRHRVEVQQALHFRQAKQDTMAVRQGAAGQARAGTARHHRHAEALAGLEYRHHLRLVLDQDHGQRHLTEGRQAIAFVGLQILGIAEQVARRHLARQLGQQPRPVDIAEILVLPGHVPPVAGHGVAHGINIARKSLAVQHRRGYSDSETGSEASAAMAASASVPCCRWRASSSWPTARQCERPATAASISGAGSFDISQAS